MKRIGWTTDKTGKVSSAVAAALLVVLALAHPVRSAAQATGVASIHGHVVNPAGVPLNKGEIRVTADRNPDAKARKYQYTFPLDQNGDFKGTGIAPGSNYIVFVFQDDKTLDFAENVSFTNGEDKAVNFDMSRPEYLAKMSPEDRKAVEEYKKKNAEVVASNAKIQNLNALLTQARVQQIGQLRRGDYSDAAGDRREAGGGDSLDHVGRRAAGRG